MRLIVAAVGKLKSGPDRALFDRYWDRLIATGRNVGLQSCDLFETIEGKSQSMTERRADEAKRLTQGAGGTGFTIALDEGGKLLTSQAFAQLLQRKIDDGVKSTVFLLGGPDGHDPALLDAADLKLSLGPMTMPHGLARIVLAEQLYRVTTILAGHPYHRS